ncbi:hypothetical protein FNAPI_4796 [Fusarium napiforme]|uniref:Uncharacterized protein n=1 Tax=Fusarium napiforme TaxID=42672 RepID=A0A8H5JR45_9HYPO|nr:hypothetical protein FNAPI_4796 [Fusarium napiforme]
MSEENPQANNPSVNFAPGSAPQVQGLNAAMGMAVYEPRSEPPNEPNHFPPEFAAEDTPQFFHQDVPENVHVNDQYGLDNGKSWERIPREQVYGNNIPPADELESHTGSRVRFDENLPSRRSRENESRRMGSHGAGSHRGQSHRDEPHGREPRSADYSEKKSHRSRKSETHRSHKPPKKEESHKTRKIDATPKYGRPSFFASLGHSMGNTTYVRYPVETKRKGK